MAEVPLEAETARRADLVGRAIPPAAGQAPSRDRAAHPLGQCRAAARDDRERAADLQRLPALRAARRPLLPEPVGRQDVPRLGPARRLAGRRPQLALRPRLAVRAHRAGLPHLSAVSGEWRSLLFRPSDVPRAWQMQLYYLRLRKEHPPQGKHNALQKVAYTSIVLLGALSVLTGFADLQAGPALLADGALRRLRARPLLALLGGLDLRRLHLRPRRPGLPGGPRLAAGDDHRLVPGEVPEP